MKPKKIKDFRTACDVVSKSRKHYDKAFGPSMSSKTISNVRIIGANIPKFWDDGATTTDQT